MSRGAWGTSRLYNTGGLTHLTGPFMFRLTACGLRLHRPPTPTIDRHRTEYLPCKRCHA